MQKTQTKNFGFMGIELDMIAQKTTLSVIWNKKNTNPILNDVLELL